MIAERLYRSVNFPTFDLRLILLSLPMSKDLKAPATNNQYFFIGSPWTLGKSWLLGLYAFRPSTIRSLIFGLLLCFPLLLLQCGLDIEDPTPPSPPVWVQKSLPEEWPERGIDAHESGGIYLEWELNPFSENIIKYEIFRAQYFDLLDSLGDFRYLTSILKAEHLDATALPSLTYYYRLRAIDDSDIQGSFSDSIAYSSFLPVRLEYMTPNGYNDLLGWERQLSWSYEYHIRMERYCITILDSENNLIIRETSNPSNYVGGSQTWSIPDEIIFNNGDQYKWRVDLEGNILDGYETVGAESLWATFKYEDE